MRKIPASFAYLSRKGSTFRLGEYLFPRIKVIREYLKTRLEVLGCTFGLGNKASFTPVIFHCISLPVWDTQRIITGVNGVNIYSVEYFLRISVNTH